MRPGSGDDPFADDDADGDADDASATDGADEESDPDRGAADTTTDESRTASETPTTTESTRPMSDTEPESQTTDTSPNRLPYIYRRDRVQDERSGVTFYLRDRTRKREDEFVDELERQLGEDVYVADAREAALEAAFQQPELVADVLREYGYDYE